MLLIYRSFLRIPFPQHKRQKLPDEQADRNFNDDEKYHQYGQCYEAVHEREMIGKKAGDFLADEQKIEFHMRSHND